MLLILFARNSIIVTFSAHVGKAQADLAVVDGHLQFARQFGMLFRARGLRKHAHLLALQIAQRPVVEHLPRHGQIAEREMVKAHAAQHVHFANAVFHTALAEQFPRGALEAAAQYVGHERALVHAEEAAAEAARLAALAGGRAAALVPAEAAVPEASAAGAARAAMAGHEGVLEKRIRSLRERLVGLAAHLDAWADYPEEDIEEVTGDALERSLAEASEEIGRLLSSFETGKILREGVDTVIAGRPNAGKSTLMNLLSGCERSIVTDVAGTTRDIVEETVLLGDIPLRLADTAGLRFTEDPVESIGVEKARQRLASAGLILAVFDSSCELNEEDRELINACRGVPSVAVINKSDLESKMDYSYIRESFRHSVVISALSGDGLAELSREVTDLLRTGALDPDEGILFTERQRDAARRAGEGVEEARQALRMGMTLDAVTVSLEGAVSALLELTGERASEAVVEQVFAHFCVGK